MTNDSEIPDEPSPLPLEEEVQEWKLDKQAVKDNQSFLGRWGRRALRGTLTLGAILGTGYLLSGEVGILDTDPKTWQYVKLYGHMAGIVGSSLAAGALQHWGVWNLAGWIKEKMFSGTYKKLNEQETDFDPKKYFRHKVKLTVPLLTFLVAGAGADYVIRKLLTIPPVPGPTTVRELPWPDFNEGVAKAFKVVDSTIHTLERDDLRRSNWKAFVENPEDGYSGPKINLPKILLTTPDRDIMRDLEWNQRKGTEIVIDDPDVDDLEIEWKGTIDGVPLYVLDIELERPEENSDIEYELLLHGDKVLAFRADYFVTPGDGRRALDGVGVWEQSIFRTLYRTSRSQLDDDPQMLELGVGKVFANAPEYAPAELSKNSRHNHQHIARRNGELFLYQMKRDPATKKFHYFVIARDGEITTWRPTAEEEFWLSFPRFALRDRSYNYRNLDLTVQNIKVDPGHEGYTPFRIFEGLRGKHHLLWGGCGYIQGMPIILRVGGKYRRINGIHTFHYIG